MQVELKKRGEVVFSEVVDVLFIFPYYFVLLFFVSGFFLVDIIKLNSEYMIFYSLVGGLVSTSFLACWYVMSSVNSLMKYRLEASEESVVIIARSRWKTSSHKISFSTLKLLHLGAKTVLSENPETLLSSRLRRNRASDLTAYFYDGHEVVFADIAKAFQKDSLIRFFDYLNDEGVTTKISI